MSTVSALLERVSRQLLSGTIEERNKLASTITSSATSVTMSFELSGLRAGTVIEIDSELMYVWEDTPSTKTITVERGYAGTTAAAHSAGAVAVVNPRFSKAQMLDALNQDIDDLSSPVNGLFRVVSADIAYNGSDRQINLTGATDVIDLMDVRLRYLADDYPVIHDVRLQRDLPTSAAWSNRSSERKAKYAKRSYAAWSTDNELAWVIAMLFYCLSGSPESVNRRGVLSGFGLLCCGLGQNLHHFVLVTCIGNSLVPVKNWFALLSNLGGFLNTTPRLLFCG